jgi:AcrR family transcriptional regulator
MPQVRKTLQQVTGLRGHRVLDPEKRSAQRNDILLAMASVVANKGYEATTLDDVANQMGCTRGVIYYQFRSKADLYVALVEKVNVDAIERLRSIASTDEPPQVQLRAALVDLVQNGWQPMDYAAIRIRRPNSIPQEARANLRILDHEYDDLFIDIVSRGMDSGALVRRDARLVALTLISAVHSIFRWARPDGTLSPEVFAEDVPAMLLEGILAHAPVH